MPLAPHWRRINPMHVQLSLFLIDRLVRRRSSRHKESFSRGDLEAIYAEAGWESLRRIITRFAP